MGYWEFQVRDSNRNFLAVLDTIKDRRYIAELNDVGSGQFTIHADSAKATTTNLAIGNIVDVVYEGTVIGAWIIEDLEEDLVSGGENSDRWVKVSGRGVMSLLDRAVVWPEGLVAEGEPTEKPASDYYPQVEYTQVSAPELLGNLWGDYVARGGSGLTFTFGDGIDTNAEVWTCGPININLNAGQSVLDVARRMMALSNFDLIARYDLTLDGYNLLGSDLSSSVTLRYGRDIMSAKKKTSGTEIANVVLGEGIDTFLMTLNSTSINTYGRRETHLPLRLTDDLSYVLVANQLLLNQYSNAPTSVDVSAICTNYVPGVNFDVGDTIGVYVPDKVDSTYRVYSWALQDGPTGPGDLRMVVELNSAWVDYLVRLRRALENELQGIKVTPGSTSNLAAGGYGAGISSGGAIAIRAFVGRQEGPHVGLWRRPTTDDKYKIFLQAVDTGNAPFFTLGSKDYETNSSWLTIGYPDKAHIRLELPSNTAGQPEQHRDLEIDPGCIFGGATGSFTTADDPALTVTVTNGIITDISEA